MLMVWNPLIDVKIVLPVAKSVDLPIQASIQLFTASGDPEAALSNLAKFTSSYKATQIRLTGSE